MPGNDANTKLLIHANKTDGIKSAFAHIKCNEVSGTNVDDSGSGDNTFTASTDTSNLTNASGKIGRSFNFTRASSEFINIDTLASDINTDSIGSFSYWVNVTQTTDNQIIAAFGDNNDDTYFNAGSITPTGSGSFQCGLLGSGGSSWDWLHRATITTGWHHIDIVQDGVAIKVYVDTVDVTNLVINNDSSTWFSAESGLYDNGRIGCLRYDSGSGIANYNFFDGELDDFRYFKCALAQNERTLLYNSGSGTEDSIILNSAINGGHTAIQTVNDAQIDTAETKWGTGSLLFDGTGDYVTIPDSADWDILADNTDNQTLDFQVFHDNVSSHMYYVQQFEDSNNRWQIYFGLGLGITFFSRLDTNYYHRIDTFVTPPTNTWFHLALIKVGPVYSIYIDGEQKGYGWDAYTDNLSGPLLIGGASAVYFDGNMDEIRVQADNYFLAAPNSFPAASLLTYGNGPRSQFTQFNGSSHVVTYPNSSDWTFGTGDWTIDGWVKFDETGSGIDTIVSQFEDGSNYWAMWKYGPTFGSGFSNYFRIYYVESNIARFDYRYTWSDYEADRWYHYAWVRNGSNVYLFIDGVSVSLSASTVVGDMADISSTLRVGYGANPANYFDGAMDEFRISKGVARWTTDFTPSTNNHATDEDAVLLVHMDGGSHADVWKDSSFSDHTPTVTNAPAYRMWNEGYGDNPITPTGTAQIQDPLEFCHMLMYDNTDIGSGENAVTNIGTPTYTSGKVGDALTLNGTDQALNVNALQSDIDTDTVGTFSFWVRPLDESADGYIFSFGDSTANDDYLKMRWDDGNLGFVVQMRDDDTNLWTWTVSAVGTYGNWHHVTIVQDGVSPKFYLNGTDITSSGTFSDSNDLTAWLGSGDTYDNGRIGCQNIGAGNSTFFYGQIDDFRYYQNQALVPFHIAKIYNDGDGMESHLSAIWFDGNNDYLTIADASGADYDMAASLTDSWTIDLWMCNAVLPTTHDFYMSIGATDFMKFFRHSLGYIGFQINISGSLVDMTADYSTDIQDLSWHHLAVVKSGSHWGMYKDGVQIYYDTQSGTGTITSALLIGDWSTPSTSTCFNGYMEQVQITKGNKFGVVPSILIADFDGTDEATAYTANTGQVATFAADAKLDSAQAKFGTTSLYLDGTDDYISFPDQDGWEPGTGNFTIDCWVYPVDVGAGAIQNSYLWYRGVNSSNRHYFQLGATGALLMRYYVGGTALCNYYTAAGAVTAGQWNHVAAVRNGSSFNIYVNGVAQSLTTEAAVGTNDLSDVGTAFLIGGSGVKYYGWLDQFRFTTGLARWTENFTPPTTADEGNGLTVPTEILTQDTITEPTEQYEPLAGGSTKSQAVIIA